MEGGASASVWVAATFEPSNNWYYNIIFCVAPKSK
jgi:hypothetical protein